MPPKIVLKRGLNRVPTGGKSIKAPKKGPKKAPKSSKQRRASSSSLSSASLDLSDDEGYSGVEDVSDSDDDEENVFAAEEEHILANARQQTKTAPPSSPRPTSSDLDGDEDQVADADDDEDSDDNENEPDEQALESMDEDGDDTSSVSWNGFASENDEPVPAQVHTAEPVSTTPVERHVRFAGVPDSESDSDETEEDVDDFFPDIFVAQDSLDSGFRREIEQDDDDDSSVSATYWDFSGAAGVPDDDDDDPYGIDEEYPNIFGSSSVNESNDVAHSKVPDLPFPEDDDESDGYESDGETTEEDEPEPMPRKKLIPILRDVSGESSDSERSEGGTPRPIKRSIKKPIVVMNPVTRKMMVITPQKKRRFDVILDPAQFQPDYFSFPNVSQTSPIMGNPGSLMMSAMSSANFFAGSLMDFQTVGPAEAFFPSGAEPYMGDDSEDSWLVDAEQEDEDAEERNLNIEDFLDFGDIGSDGQDEADKSDDGNTDGTPSRRSSMAPSALGDSNTDVHPLLSHLTNNADAVGAFRRNQVNQQLILNGQATQESLAFSNPLYHGTLRGIKHGSLGGAATPLTPERRHKKALAKSPSEA
ncbi:hypothetical protein diail_7973, partial [Diaporthe ilicicola]